MNLFERVRFFFRTLVDDLIAEESGPAARGYPKGKPAAGAAEARLEEMLAKAREQLIGLQTELVEAEARREKARIEWEAKASETKALDREVDSALQAGDETLARQRQEMANRAREQAARLEERFKANAQLVNRLEEAVAGLKARLASAQLESQTLADQQRSLESLEQLAQIEREMRRTADDLDTELRRQKEQVLRREDYLALRDEIGQQKESGKPK